MPDGKVDFLRDTMYLNGHPVRCAIGLDYVRVLGRHTLPLLFHLADSRTMFSCTRSACRLHVSRLPANYPLAMFVAKCHGKVSSLRSVRPSLRFMCVLPPSVTSRRKRAEAARVHSTVARMAEAAMA